MKHPIASLSAPAKVNLNLAVFPPRTDGLHPLESLMVPVSLFDQLVVKSFVLGDDNGTTRIDVDSDRRDVPSGTQNLVHFAAERFADRVGRKLVLHVDIHKRIPAGAGLGGGSSDAATILTWLNARLGQPLANHELAELAATIGADVPFFLEPGAKRVAGIGDVLLPYDGELPANLVLCSDGTQLATAAVFRTFDALTSERGISRKPGSVFASPSPLAFFNDLEEAAVRLHPGIEVAKRAIRRRGVETVAMTGSGSVVFGVVEKQERAAEIAAQLRGEGYWSEAVETLR